MSKRPFAESKEAKAAGWHSCRHETNAAQTEARERYQEGRGPNVRKGKRRQKKTRRWL